MFKRGNDIGFDLLMANLRNVEFNNEDLCDRDFTGEDLNGALFDTCSLIRSCFKQCDLRNARFIDCKFYAAQEPGVEFSYSNLREARFVHCDLTTAQFGNIKGYDLTLKDCQLTGADFAKADFRLPVGQIDLASLTMTGCNFSYGNLSHCFLKGAVLTENRMIEVLAHNTVLDEACFDGSDLSNLSGRGMSIRGADLRGARFNNLNPREIDLSGVRITVEQAPWLLDALGIVLE